MASPFLHSRQPQDLLSRWSALLRVFVSGMSTKPPTPWAMARSENGLNSRLLLVPPRPGLISRARSLLSLLSEKLGSDRRSFERRTRECAEESFRILVESAPDAIVGVDRTGRIALVNGQAEALFGYSRTEILGQPIEILVPESQRAAHRRSRQVYQGDPHRRPMGTMAVPLYGLRKDGTTFPAEISLSPMTMEAGPLVTSIIRDVTQRMQAEAQRDELLRAQEARAQAELAQQRFHELVQDLNAIVWELDIPTGRLTFVSRRAQEMLGYPLDLWLAEGGQWLRHIHPDDLGGITAQIEARQSGSFEYRAITADGRQLWLRLILQVAQDEKGLPRQLRGLTVDITERKLAEETARVSEKLAATLQLASSLAHEINNPVSGVTNLLYLIEQQSTGNEQIRTYSQTAQEELKRVAHITRQMLAFYRDSSAAVPVDLGLLLHSIVELYGPRLHHEAISVDVCVETQRSIQGFLAELRQAFSNLLLNAIEASPGGQIRIKVHTAHDWANLARAGVHITVADNGSGIAAKDRAHVFEPFFTIKPASGTGLGLWVTDGIVRKHGGSIRLHSSIRPGRSGTAVSIFLPLEPTAPPEDPKTVRAAACVA